MAGFAVSMFGQLQFNMCLGFLGLGYGGVGGGAGVGY
jgi:hypothetical protein